MAPGGVVAQVIFWHAFSAVHTCCYYVETLIDVDSFFTQKIEIKLAAPQSASLKNISRASHFLCMDRLNTVLERAKNHLHLIVGYHAYLLLYASCSK
jgi:hypothetical protein